jgi:pyrroloquinoline quinone (PQQ) biosynthesis protein C
MVPNEFVQEVRNYAKYQEEQPVLGAAFYKGLVNGELPRDQVKIWALNMFYVAGQHIRAFGGMFLNTGLGPLDQQLRRHIVGNLFDEETTEGRGDDAHWALAMRLAKALGTTDEELMQPVVAKEAVEYVEWVLELARREYGLVTLAAMSNGETANRDEPQKAIIQALEAKYGLSRKDVEFFYAHLGEIEAHGEPVLEMVREYATTEERQQKIRGTVRAWWEKWRAASEGIYRVVLGLEQGIQVDLNSRQL